MKDYENSHKHKMNQCNPSNAIWKNKMGIYKDCKTDRQTETQPHLNDLFMSPHICKNPGHKQ